MTTRAAGTVSVDLVQRPGRSRALSAVPNLISGCRLLATPVLLWAAVNRMPRLFAWLLLACLLSDIADGFIARTLHLESRLGAALDTTADFLVTVLSAIGIATMQWPFVNGHAWQLELLVALFGLEVVSSLVRYRRLSSFHTYLVRAAAYLQGAFVLSLFFWGYQGWLFYPMWLVSCLSQIEEWILLALLPKWTPDVRGLYWVLKARRR